MWLELHLADRIVDRAQHRQHHPAEDRAEDDGHRRLYHHLHFADRILDVAVVEVGHAELRGVEYVGGFAHAQHAYHQRRKQAHVLERGGHVLAFGDLLPGTFQALLDHQIAGDFLGALDAVENGDAGRIHHGENAGEARQDDLAQDRPEKRHTQLEIVEAVAERGAALEGDIDADDGDHRSGQNRPPIADEESRDVDQDARLQRDRLAQALDEAHHLRHQVDHQEHGHREHDAADEGRVHHQLLRLRDQFVLPLQVFRQALEHLRHAPGFLAGADQAGEHRGEYVRVVGHGTGQVLPALDALDQPGDDFAKAQVLDAVAQVGQRLEDGHAGGGELLQVEAEVDQLGPPDRALEYARALARRAADDQIEPHALQAQLQIDQVDGFDLAHERLAAAVDRLVGVQRHACREGQARYMRSVRSTTRMSSSSVVVPSSTRREPSSARVRKPLAMAASCSSRAVARRAISSSMSTSSLSISMIASRPR